jgi:hypothetical protein
MESSSARRPRRMAPPELDRLELSVRRLLESHDAWRRRASHAEARVSELEQTVQQLSEGSLDPVALAERVRLLEERNRSLRERMDAAHDAVQKMLARLQFAEEER